MSVKKEKIRLLHLNDLHSHFEAYPKLKRFFDDKSQTEAEVIKLDLGDNIDKSHPMTEVTAGCINTQLMNDLGIQFATIGNNEGIGLNKEELNRVYDKAQFKLVLSNLEDEQGAPKWSQPYAIYQTKYGTKIAFLGATYPYTLTYAPNGWQVLEPIASLKNVLEIPEIRESDVVILLSHLGISVDEKITQMLPEIDIIIGAHTHHVFEEGAVLNGVYLAAAGKYGQFVGEINLVFCDHKLADVAIEAYETRYLPSYLDDAKWVADFKTKGRELLKQEEVTSLSHDLTLEESCDIVMKAMLAYGKADVTIMNTGLVVDPFPSHITNDTLHHALPHQMRLVRLSVTFQELEEIIQEVFTVGNLLKTQEIRGMGFRGKCFGDICLEGLTYKNQKIVYNDKVHSGGKISLIVVDQYYFAPYFEMIKKHPATLLFPELLRDVVKNYLKGEL